MKNCYDFPFITHPLAPSLKLERGKLRFVVIDR